MLRGNNPLDTKFYHICTSNRARYLLYRIYVDLYRTKKCGTNVSNLPSGQNNHQGDVSHGLGLAALSMCVLWFSLFLCESEV